MASKASQTMDKEDDSEWKTNDWCKEIHIFLPPNTWIVNKKQAYEEILTHAGYEFNGFELKHKNPLAG